MGKTKTGAAVFVARYGIKSPKMCWYGKMILNFAEEWNPEGEPSEAPLRDSAGIEIARLCPLSESERGEVVIQKFADLRLITTGQNEEGKQTLEVVHEALIREWGKLREWINADREFRVWQEKIRYAEKEWETTGKKSEGLLRGSNLTLAEDWYSKRKEDLSQREIEFIEESIKERDRIQREKEEAQEREKQREIDSQRKKRRLTQFIALGSAVVAVLAGILSYWALDQKAEAVANGLKAEAILLQNNYETKKDFMKSYYEILKVAIKGEEVSDQFSVHKLNIVSTLYNFVYIPTPVDYYTRYTDLEKPDFFGRPTLSQKGNGRGPKEM